MLEKLPFYGQILVCVVVVLLILTGAYFLWPNFGEMKATIDRFDEEYARQEVEIQKGRAIEARLPEFEQEIAALERKLGDIQKILPTNQETGELLRWIKNVGDQSNLDLKSFSPGALVPVEFYKQFPIEMQVVGRYHELGLFLDRVSKYERIINVDNLAINGVANEGDKTIRASFTATTFVYDPAVEVEE